MNDDIHALAGAYLLDAVDDLERRAFEQHLAGCASCQQDLAELRPALTALADDAVAVPPTDLRARVLASIGEVRPLPPLVAEPAASEPGPRNAHDAAFGDEPPASGTASRFRSSSTWILAVAAALVLLVGTVVMVRALDDGDAGPTVQAVVDAPDARTLVQTIDGHRAEIVVSRSEDRVALRSSDLPPAPDGRTYQLWYARPGQGLVSAGLLAPGDDGHAAVLEGPLGDATAVGLTVEPAGGSAEPTTEPLLVVELA